MSLDLERQLSAYTAVLDEAAPPVTAPVGQFVPTRPKAVYARGLAVAAAAAIVVVLLIGSLILLAPMADEPPVLNKPVTTTMQATTTTIPPVEGVSVEGFVVTGALEAGLVSDLSIAEDGTVWAVVLDTDFSDPMYYGLWDSLDSPEWAIVKQAGAGWEVVTGEDDPSVPDELGSMNWFAGPQILGFRPDGGVWIHDLPQAPEGPLFLWEYKNGEWIDHTEAAHLPGHFDRPVSMDCCLLGIDDDGVLWVRSEDWATVDLDGLWTEDDFGSLVTVRSRFDGEWKPTDEPLPRGLARDNLRFGGIERGDVRWTLSHSWERTGTWTVRGVGAESRRFAVDYDTLEENLTCSPNQGVFDLDTESAIASDGALWTAWPCIGVTRVDPADGSMTLISEGLPSSDMWRIKIAADDTVWVAGTGGIATITREA